VRPFHSTIALLLLPITLLLALASSDPATVFAEEALPPPWTSPFGPPYDPTRPPPQEPQQTGPGIVSAKVAIVGPAEIEELATPDASDPKPYAAVVLDVEIAAGSTTTLLAPASVVAKSEDGESMPVFAICTPTAEAPVTVFHGAGGKYHAWHVAVADRIFFCGGRNARLAVELGEGGMRLTTPDAWSGPMLLFFKTPAPAIRRVVLAGREIELPKPESPTAGANTH
jgi:hypothetical protein